VVQNLRQDRTLGENEILLVKKKKNQKQNKKQTPKTQKTKNKQTNKQKTM
jgi:hypothetical protein